MKSATAISYELDDIDLTVRELIGQIRLKLTLRKHTVAILHGQPDMDIAALSAEISRSLGCDVIGGTTAGAAVLTNAGHHELAVVLHVLTGDDCLFSAAISGSLGSDPKREIHSVYQTALDRLREQQTGAEPRMVLSVMPIVSSISSDNGLSELSEVCGGLPVFGYNAADVFEFCNQQVYLNGTTGGDRMAILLLSGDVRPIFEVKNLAGHQTLEKKLVTRARDNVICEIDGKPAYEYIKDFPFIDDNTEVLWNYQFFVEMKNATDNDGVPVSRALNTYDRESGEISCFADVPQDSYIGLLYCDGDDVKRSSETALTALLSKLSAQESGYEYSTVLVASCSLRNMLLADRKDTEGNLIGELIPPNLTVSGLYAFGEAAPTSIREGRAVNRFHNATFALCAI